MNVVCSKSVACSSCNSAGYVSNWLRITYLECMSDPLKADSTCGGVLLEIKKKRPTDKSF